MKTSINKINKKYILSVSLVLAITSMVHAVNPIPAVIPKPTSMTLQNGVFILKPDTLIIAGTDSLATAKQLSDMIGVATGFSLKIDLKRTSNSNVIILELNSALSNLGDEGYRLQVVHDKVTIQASKPAGLFYGIQTLRQLLPPEIYQDSKAENVEWAIGMVEIEDKPRFPWRGVMLDASRHFQTKQFVKRYLDLMAMHKLNTFHWHLTDDHGWRIEIKKYPKLTEIGAWRNQPGYDKGPYGGFYTQQDIREVLQYAKKLHITVVPEIEMPGHSGEVFAAYPHLSCTEEQQETTNFINYPCRKKDHNVAEIPKVDAYCAGKEETFKFLEDVLTEVMALFPSEYIHIGGDEVNKQWWKGCAKCQARKKLEKLRDEKALQSYFVKRIEKFINANGRRMIGWDEILEGGLAPNATVMSWRGIGGGIVAARAGHDVVMTPQQFLYFDHYQSKSLHHPAAWPGVSTLQTVYDFEPVPQELTAEQKKHILGAQANMWTVYTHTPELIELMSFPRMCALSEITWSPRQLRNRDDFNQRMNIHFKRLDALKVNYYRGTSLLMGQWSPGQITQAGVTRQWDATEHIKGKGEYQVTLDYTKGAHGLVIHWVALLQDDKEVARDTHPGFTGFEKKNITYKLNLPVWKKGARYTIQAHVAGAGGNDSYGDVFLVVP